MINPFNSEYYTEEDLKSVGFKSLGKNVKIYKNSIILGLNNITIGDNVIIDSYCTILATGQAELKIGSFVHIGGYSMLAAGEGITIQDFSGLSHGVKIYSIVDDYSGTSLTNPTIPEKYTNRKRGPVVLESHVIIGAQTIILPDVTIGEGSSVGALSLVSTNLSPWGMYLGHPLKRLKNRSKHLLTLRDELLKEK